MSRKSTLVKLNIGGHVHITYYDTLIPSKYFMDLLDTYDEWHELFVDRSGVLFEHVLQFLRSMHLVGDYTQSELIELKEEAKYYDIKEMDQVIERKLYDLSIYMSSREYKLMDLSELEGLSCVQESSAETHNSAYSISEKYDIITVVKYNVMRNRGVQSKLLVAKK